MTVLPYIVSAETTYSFLNLKILGNSNSCRKFQFFYLINRIFALEAIQVRKLKTDRKWKWQKFFQKFISEKFKKQFYSFICILPDYLSHESSKIFWKKRHFKDMRAGFLRRCQNSLRQNSPKIMHFQAWKKMFLTNIML